MSWRPAANSGRISMTPSASCLTPRPFGICFVSLYALFTNPIGRGVNIARHHRMRAVKKLLVVLAMLIPLPLCAWGEKGHYLSNEAATFGLPNDMPSFFYRAYLELIFLGYD